MASALFVRWVGRGESGFGSTGNEKKRGDKQKKGAGERAQNRQWKNALEGLFGESHDLCLCPQLIEDALNSGG
jgi:ribosome modulation factor